MSGWDVRKARGNSVGMPEGAQGALAHIQEMMNVEGVLPWLSLQGSLGSLGEPMCSQCSLRFHPQRWALSGPGWSLCPHSQPACQVPWEQQKRGNNFALCHPWVGASPHRPLCVLCAGEGGEETAGCSPDTRFLSLSPSAPPNLCGPCSPGTWDS